MENQIPKKKLWNPNIQSLRGLSILLVLISHFFGKPAQFGAIGVGIFFCISGYLITDILISEYRETGQIRIVNFYKRRARRLLPLAFLVISLTVIFVGISFTFSDSLSQDAQDNNFGDLRHYFLSALFCFFYIGNLFGFAHLGYNDLAPGLAHFWTLAVEEQFYFIWPVLLYAVLKKWNSLLSLICILGILATPAIHLVFFAQDKTSWTLPTSYLDLFFFGALFTIYRKQIERIQFSKLLILMGSLVVALIVIYGIQLEDFASQGYLIFTSAEILLFLGLFNWKPFGDIMLLRRLGDLSYALYCIHWPIIILFDNLEMNAMLKKAITLALSFSLAALSTKYFESRFWTPGNGKDRGESL